MPTIRRLKVPSWAKTDQVTPPGLLKTLTRMENIFKLKLIKGMIDQELKNNFIEVDFNPFEDINEIEKIIQINESQREIWLSCIIGGDEASLAYNESISLNLTGTFHLEYFVESINKVVSRH